ncbi:MAG TPA: SDR family NAD(P)-dependent oxidoreductase [Ktedonobacteraceae bacterium]|jgi:short-subunit dehydrogenase|nr:SDR family NAD(P)-dependent oxidoreductase [Ktedonobacteraceae bacterium]
MRKNWLTNPWTLAAAGTGLLFVGKRLLERRLNIDGKVVLISGGSRGLGLAMAEEFGRRGAKLVLLARDAQELMDAQKILADEGIEAITIPCDITDERQVHEMVEQALRRVGQIDVLVNNAGIITAGPLQTLTREDFEYAMNDIFWGTLNMTMAVLPHMQERKQGRIVNIASIGGKVSVPRLLPYSSAKFAVVGFSEGLRAELLRQGILVTTIAPGLMRTGSTVNTIMKGAEHEQEYTWFTLLDTLPFSSISAKRAAKQIVSATERGSAEVIISIQAQVLARLHGLLPGTTSDLMALMNQLLPGKDDASKATYTGKESETPVTQSPITTLGQKATQRYNEEKA